MTSSRAQFSYKDHVCRISRNRSVTWACETCKHDERMSTARLLQPAERKQTSGSTPALNISFAYDKANASSTALPAGSVASASSPALAPAASGSLAPGTASRSVSDGACTSPSPLCNRNLVRLSDADRVHPRGWRGNGRGHGAAGGQARSEASLPVTPERRSTAPSSQPSPSLSPRSPPASTVAPNRAYVPSMADLQRQQRLDQMIAFLFVLVIGLLARRLLASDDPF